MKKSLFILFILIISFTFSCKHTPSKNTIGDIVCDLQNVSYQNCVKPVLINNCYSCHSDTASGNGSKTLDLENFSALKNYLNIYYHNDSIYGSKFIHTINQTQGVLPMPPTYKLTDNELKIIKLWVDKGAPNN